MGRGDRAGITGFPRYGRVYDQLDGTISIRGIAMIIPLERLSPEALRGLIEEFVTRDGTDSGYVETSLEQSVGTVIRQLKRGDTFIVYDEATQTANIVPKDYLKKAELDERA